MQRRSATSSYLPLHWSTSVGGHVQSGESYEDATHREMIEEIGIDGTLMHIGKYIYHSDDGLIKHITVFESVIDDGFIPGENEVAELKFMNSESFDSLIQTNKNIHPELLDIWKRYYMSL
jgi:isopentenyldiphosphate isomerase